jgi:hypothetical protein
MSGFDLNADDGKLSQEFSVPIADDFKNATYDDQLFESLNVGSNDKQNGGYSGYTDSYGVGNDDQSFSNNTGFSYGVSEMDKTAAQFHPTNSPTLAKIARGLSNGGGHQQGGYDNVNNQYDNLSSGDDNQYGDMNNHHSHHQGGNPRGNGNMNQGGGGYGVSTGRGMGVQPRRYDHNQQQHAPYNNPYSNRVAEMSNGNGNGNGNMQRGGNQGGYGGGNQNGYGGGNQNGYGGGSSSNYGGYGDYGYQQGGDYGQDSGLDDMNAGQYNSNNENLSYADEDEMNDCAIPQGFVYMVHFKRSHRYFSLAPSLREQTITRGSFVVVEADRGEDLGIVGDLVPTERFWAIRFATISKKMLKSIIRVATRDDVQALINKTEDETVVTQICQEILLTTHPLPIDIIDAEYQYDRNKLTIYHDSRRRNDFRGYVRDLFCVFKTRIWMQQVDSKSEPHPISTRMTFDKYQSLSHSNGGLLMSGLGAPGAYSGITSDRFAAGSAALTQLDKNGVNVHAILEGGRGVPSKQRIMSTDGMNVMKQAVLPMISDALQSRMSPQMLSQMHTSNPNAHHMDPSSGNGNSSPNGYHNNNNNLYYRSSETSGENLNSGPESPLDISQHSGSNNQPGVVSSESLTEDLRREKELLCQQRNDLMKQKEAYETNMLHLQEEEKRIRELRKNLEDEKKIFHDEKAKNKTNTTTTTTLQGQGEE